jgi:hypothetical protein
MKSKKAMEAEALKGMILILFIAVVTFSILFTSQDLIAGETNIQQVRSWVVQSAVEQELSEGLASNDRPPVPYLQEPIEFETLEELKNEAVPAIAMATYDCERAFEFGTKDYMSLRDMEGVNCFQCAQFKFSDELKAKNYKLSGLQHYMHTNSPTSTGETYIDILTEKSKGKFAIITEQGSTDSMPISNDLYVYAVGMKGREGCSPQNPEECGISNPIFLTGTGVAATGIAGTAALTFGVVAAGPVAWVATGAVAVGGLATMATELFQGKEFTFYTYVGTPQLINEMCSA